MRKKIVAGNWKMNCGAEEASRLAKDIVSLTTNNDKVQIVLAPPLPFLERVRAIIRNEDGIALGAQNCHSKESGAFTGEVSADMLSTIDVEYVLVGHSERREYFNEDDAFLGDKVNAILSRDMIPIFCCGEPLAIREADTQADFVTNQIAKGLFHLSENAFTNIVIAYEPIWAIGTGKTASTEQAQAMHATIRAFIASRYGNDIANQTRILYGGSCNAQNAAALFSQPDIDGGLIGGASLKPHDFKAIIEAAAL